MFKFNYSKYNPQGLNFGEEVSYMGAVSISKVGSETARGLYTVGLIIGILQYIK